MVSAAKLQCEKDKSFTTLKVELISEKLQTKHNQGPGPTEHTDAKLGSAALGRHKVLLRWPFVQKSHIEA